MSKTIISTTRFVKGFPFNSSEGDEKKSIKSLQLEEFRKAEKEYYQRKLKIDRQLLEIKKQEHSAQINIETQKLQLKQAELEFQAELSASRFQLLRKFQQENVNQKWQEIQVDWDSKQNWFSKINRFESEAILSKYADSLLILTSPPQIAKDSNLRLFRNLDFELQMRNLDDFLEKNYPSVSVSHPVKHYSDYFKEPIGRIEINQLHNLLNKIAVYVIYPDITTKKINFRIAYWAINGDLIFFPEPIEWYWLENQRKIIEQGKSELQSALEIRDLFVEIYKILTALLSDSYYLSIDPFYKVRFDSLCSQLSLKLPAELITQFQELEQQQQQKYFNYLRLQTMTEETMNPNKIREQFANYLVEVVKVMEKAEMDGKKNHSSGELSLGSKIQRLKQKATKLNNNKFNIALIGEFSRGKTSILNILLNRPDFLPTSDSPTTSLPTYIKYGKKEKVSLFFSSSKDKEKFLQEPRNKKIKLISKGEQSITFTLESYKKFFTLDSDFVEEFIDNLFNFFRKENEYIEAKEKATKEWIKGKEYFEVELPLPVLEEGVQYIDTAGLNDLENISNETKKEINNCDAILFILTADQLCTSLEEQYLEDISKNSGIKIFYLINKWENVEVSKQEEVKKRLIRTFRRSFNFDTKEEVEKLWGDRLFKIQSKKAKNKLTQSKKSLDKLKKQEKLELLDGTGFVELDERLNHFLLNERLQHELSDSVEIVKQSIGDCQDLIFKRLELMKLGLEGLTKVIEKTEEPLEEINQICLDINSIINASISNYKTSVINSYRNTCNETKKNIEGILRLNELDNLKEETKEQYQKKLQKDFVVHVTKALESWVTQSQNDLVLSVNNTKSSVKYPVDKYNELMKKINKIIQETIENEAVNIISDRKGSNKEVSVERLISPELNLVGSSILMGTAGAGGTILGTAGALGLAHGAGWLTTVGLWTTNPVTGALVLTPVGAGLLVVSAAVGAGLALWNRGKKKEEFKNAIISQLQKKLDGFIQDDYIEKIKQDVQNSAEVAFSSLTETQQRMLENSNDLKNSLLNQKKQLEDNQVNYGAEESRLINLERQLSQYLNKITTEYEKLFPSG